MPLDLSRLRIRRRKAASGIDYGVLVGLVAVASLGAVALTGERVRSLFSESESRVGDGVAALPTPPDDGVPPPPPPAGQGVWSGDGAFAIAPATGPQARAFLLTNVGAGALAVGSPTLSGPDAASFDLLGTTCGGTLSSGAACEATVQASASQDGTATAVLSGGGASTALSRTASGFVPLLVWSGGGAIAIDGTPLSGSPTSGERAFTLTNQGFADAAGVSPALSGPDAARFSLSHNCPAVLAPGEACTAVVSTSATGNGTFGGVLSAGGPASADQAVAAAASGFAPLFAWSGAAPLAVVAPTSNPQPATRIVLLTNLGTAPGTPGALSIAGDATGYTLSVASGDCGAELPVGGSCQATVTATFTDNVATLSGILFAGGVATPLTGSASGFAPAWTFDALPSGDLAIANPTVVPATVGRGFSLRNTGTLPGVPPPPFLSGANAADFITYDNECQGTTVAPGDTCQMSVQFRATGNVSGRTATLAVGDATKALTGSLTGAPVCTPGNRVLSTVGSGTFVRPAGTEPCAFRALLVGGGGAGFRTTGESSFGGPVVTGGPGGGSAQTRQLTWQPNAFPASVPYTIAAGGGSSLSCFHGSAGNGGLTIFGAAVAGGSYGGVQGGCPGSPIHPVAGTGGSAGGGWGQNGGSNGGTVAGNGAGTPQGSGFAAAFAGFTQRTVSAAPGGATTSVRSAGGGGGGGVLISGVGPAQAAGHGANSGTNAGQGFGGGGGGASLLLNAQGGRGASGVIYIEWSAP